VTSITCLLQRTVLGGATRKSRRIPCGDWESKTVHVVEPCQFPAHAR
jgi:hypothetical protein